MIFFIVLIVSIVVCIFVDNLIRPAVMGACSVFLVLAFLFPNKESIIKFDSEMNEKKANIEQQQIINKNNRAIIKKQAFDSCMQSIKDAAPNNVVFNDFNEAIQSCNKMSDNFAEDTYMTTISNFK